MNDVQIYDTVSNTWTTPALVGLGPEPRWGHSAAAVGRYLVFFGGKAGKTLFNDIFLLDLGVNTV